MSRTQAQRSAATRDALTRAARKLWGERGYAAVGTTEIAQAAGVTRGAMYHQYEDKAALFIAVLRAVDEDIIRRMDEAAVAAAPPTPIDAMHAIADAWLNIAAEPEIRQLLLLDGPSVLGWERFRELGQSSARSGAEELLTSAIEAGQVKPQPVRPLATILLAAFDEAVMSIAHADDPEREREQVRAVVHDLIDGLLIRPA